MKTSYELAYNLACEELAKLDLEKVAFNSSARLVDRVFEIDFLGETFIVKEHGKEIATKSHREVKLSEKILIMHYLVTSDGAPLQGEEVTLEKIPSAAFYYPTYKARTIDLIISRCPSGQNFIERAKGIGFNPASAGRDNLYRLKSLVLPNVPLHFILWNSSDNTPDIQRLKILYDASITHYLPLEDIIILTEFVSHKIIKSSETISYLK
jgi:hypothetical protein